VTGLIVFSNAVGSWSPLMAATTCGTQSGADSKCMDPGIGGVRIGNIMNPAFTQFLTAIICAA